MAGPWELCTGRISYSHDAGSMIPYHKNLTMLGYRALIYRCQPQLLAPDCLNLNNVEWTLLLLNQYMNLLICTKRKMNILPNVFFIHIWFMTAVTMICACHLPEVKRGLDLWDIRFWMNGDPGSLIAKLLGTYIN